MDEIKRVQLIAGLAVILGRDLTKEAIKIYCSTLQDLTYTQLDKACTIWMNKPNSPFFPSPGQLRACLALTDEELAREAVSRVLETLNRYAVSGVGGEHDSIREQKARDHIGSLGWEIVNRRGGWYKLSTTTTNDDIGTNAQAQMRELCISILRQHRLGLQDVRPMLPNASVIPKLEEKPTQEVTPHYLPAVKLSELFKPKASSEMSELDVKKRIEELKKQAEQLYGHENTGTEKK